MEPRLSLARFVEMMAGQPLAPYQLKLLEHFEKHPEAPKVLSRRRSWRT
jgi:hypothetical protein